MKKTQNLYLITRKRLFFIIICGLFLLIFHDILPEFTDEIVDSSIKQEPDNIATELQLSTLISEEDKFEFQKTGFSCNSDWLIEVCIANKQMRIDTKSLNVYLSPSDQEITSDVKDIKIVKPYGAKKTSTAMDNVTPVQIIQGTNSSIMPNCEYIHMVPVVVFSIGGFSGNVFHDISDIFIPLFLTSRHFRSQVQFIITDCHRHWIRKYEYLLKQLSSYEIIIVDKSNRTTGNVHCFPGGVVGLKYHEYFGIDSTKIPKGYEIEDFRQFLFESYDLKVDKLLKKPSKPVVLFISRKRSRMWLNEDEIVYMIVGLGFDVRIALPSDMGDFKKDSKLVNSCHVMVGVHGAGFTNEVFLAKGAVVVQVVPIGMEWASTSYYAKPGSKMGLKSLEYNVAPEESSLSESYSLDDPVITNPSSIFAKEYSVARELYFSSQNVRINVTRFRETMVQAFQLLQV